MPSPRTSGGGPAGWIQAAQNVRTTCRARGERTRIAHRAQAADTASTPRGSTARGSTARGAKRTRSARGACTAHAQRAGDCSPALCDVGCRGQKARDIRFGLLLDLELLHCRLRRGDARRSLVGRLDRVRALLELRQADGQLALARGDERLGDRLLAVGDND